VLCQGQFARIHHLHHPQTRRRRRRRHPLRHPWSSTRKITSEATTLLKYGWKDHHFDTPWGFGDNRIGAPSQGGLSWSKKFSISGTSCALRDSSITRCRTVHLMLYNDYSVLWWRCGRSKWLDSGFLVNMHQLWLPLLDEPSLNLS
jgi:hypothetical protein